MSEAAVRMSDRSFRITGSVGELRKMHLRDRCTRDRHAVESQEDLVHGPAVDPLKRREHVLDGKRRYAVLKLGELVGNVRG